MRGLPETGRAAIPGLRGVSGISFAGSLQGCARFWQPLTCYFLYLNSSENTVKTIVIAITIALILLVVIGNLPSVAAPATADQIARGKYIVDQVAVCGDCHSAHNEKGEPVPGKE